MSGFDIKRAAAWALSTLRRSEEIKTMMRARDSYSPNFAVHAQILRESLAIVATESPIPPQESFKQVLRACEDSLSVIHDLLGSGFNFKSMFRFKSELDENINEFRTSTQLLRSLTFELKMTRMMADFSLATAQVTGQSKETAELQEAFGAVTYQVAEVAGAMLDSKANRGVEMADEIAERLLRELRSDERLGVISASDLQAILDRLSSTTGDLATTLGAVRGKDPFEIQLRFIRPTDQQKLPPKGTFKAMIDTGSKLRNLISEDMVQHFGWTDQIQNWPDDGPTLFGADLKSEFKPVGTIMITFTRAEIDRGKHWKENFLVKSDASFDFILGREWYLRELPHIYSKVVAQEALLAIRDNIGPDEKRVIEEAEASFNLENKKLKAERDAEAKEKRESERMGRTTSLETMAGPSRPQDGKDDTQYWNTGSSSTS